MFPLHSDVGITPENALLDIFKLTRLRRFPKDDGKVLWNALFAKLSDDSFLNPPNTVGRDPCNEFDETLKVDSCCSSHIELGNVPVKLFCVNDSDLRECK